MVKHKDAYTLFGIKIFVSASGYKSSKYNLSFA